MRENIPMELDFVMEGRNADKCRKIFENDPQITVYCLINCVIIFLKGP